MSPISTSPDLSTVLRASECESSEIIFYCTNKQCDSDPIMKANATWPCIWWTPEYRHTSMPMWLIKKHWHGFYHRIFNLLSSTFLQRVDRCNNQTISVCPSVCPSVRPSVTFRCFVQKNEDTIVRFSASDWTILVSGEVKLIRIFAGDHPQRGR